VLPRQQAPPHNQRGGGNRSNQPTPHEEAPGGNYPKDDGAVDDGSYDGDESDSSDSSSEDDQELFHYSPTSQELSFEPQTRRSRARCTSNRPIRSQKPHWWGSENDEATQCRNTHLSRKPHPPVQLVVEQFKVMEIWGSDYFTDSFSEMSSSSESSSCDEDSGYPQLQRSLKKPSTKQTYRSSTTLRDMHKNTSAAQMDRDIQASQTDVYRATQSLTRLYSDAPSLSYPIECGLDKETTYAYSYPPRNGRLSLCCDNREIGGLNGTAGCGDRWSLTGSWGRKSSSEESWFTANEDLELGTLV